MEKFWILSSQILEYGDVDGDGYLEINEFKRMLEKHPDFPEWVFILIK